MYEDIGEKIIMATSGKKRVQKRKKKAMSPAVRLAMIPRPTNLEGGFNTTPYEQAVGGAVQS